LLTHTRYFPRKCGRERGEGRIQEERGEEEREKRGKKRERKGKKGDKRGRIEIREGWTNGNTARYSGPITSDELEEHSLRHQPSQCQDSVGTYPKTFVNQLFVSSPPKLTLKYLVIKIKQSTKNSKEGLN
jgi:hypothetical protein